MINRTKDAYESYLNEVLENDSPHQLSVPDGTYISNPGTWMRLNDPIQFRVGYNEWLNALDNS
jgi:hypothetical protein